MLNREWILFPVRVVFGVAYPNVPVAFGELNTLPPARWAQQLEVVRTLMAGWWEQPEKQVRPPTLVTGHDLISEFDLTPGPQIGELLEIVREGQVMGEVNTKTQALEFIAKSLKSI